MKDKMLSLASAFPDLEAIRDFPVGITAPELWHPLLKGDVDDYCAGLADAVGGSSEVARPMQHSILDIGVLRPKSKKRRGKSRFLRLAILFRSGKSVSFVYPEPELILATTELPEEFCLLARRMGAFHFPFGSSMWPSEVGAVSNDILVGNSFHVLPFFSFETGDYLAWQVDDFDRVMLFDHETCRLIDSYAGSFGEWFLANLATIMNQACE